MTWLMGLVVGGMIVIIIGLHRRVRWLEGRVKGLEDWVRAIQSSLDADHELLLTITTIAGKLNAIDALEHTGFKAAADAIRLGESTDLEHTTESPSEDGEQ